MGQAIDNPDILTARELCRGTALMPISKTQLEQFDLTDGNQDFRMANFRDHSRVHVKIDPAVYNP